MCRPSIEVRFEAKFYHSSRNFQWYVACHLHTRKSGRFLTFNGRESNWQIDSWPFIWPQLMFKLPKWVMRAHFRHPSSKRFSMKQKTFQFNGFWPLKLFFEDSKVHRDSNSQSGSSLGSVEVHSLTFSHTLGSMKCDSWASFLAHTFASPCLGREPKTTAVTLTHLGSNKIIK